VSGAGELSWLALIPRDTVFIRDGRSFDAAADATATTVWPLPSTIAGAVGAAYGAQPDAQPDTVPDEVRGPVLGRRSETGWEPFFPVPADLVEEVGVSSPYAFRLALAPADGASTDLDAAGLRWLVPPAGAGRVQPLGTLMSGGRGAVFISGSQLASYLAGDLPPGDEGIEVAGLELATPLKPELRIGLARELDRRVRTGFLYQATHWRPEEGWGFLAGCLLRDGWRRVAAGPVSLGGRGRLADAETAGEVSWPARPEQFPGGRVLVYLATPAVWPGGWRIPEPAGARLVAAATGEPEQVATMTADRGRVRNRTLRWAVPAGSVFLLEFGDEQRAADWAGQVHGTAYGRDRDDRLRTAGFGVVLTGAWK
jgi:CRISPR type III-B/RAMP module-associated protein Cmr3